MVRFELGWAGNRNGSVMTLPFLLLNRSNQGVACSMYLV